MFLAVWAGAQSGAWMYHTLTKLRKQCHGQQPTGGWKNEAKHNIITRHKVLGKHIPVPKTLLAFHKLATAEVLRSFAFSPKEDTKCDRYPEQSQTSANFKWGIRIILLEQWNECRLQLAEHESDNCSGLLAEGCNSLKSLFIPLDSSPASNSGHRNVFPLSRRKRSLPPPPKALKR